MNVLEKVNLIENIASEMQQRFTFSVIDIFLAEFDVKEAPDGNYSSKRSYVSERIKGIPTKELKRIADELNIDTQNLIKTPPKNWEDVNSAKAFISHTANDKAIAMRLRDVLRSHNIECFVAHEDIKPSEEWQEEIRRALDTMDFFLSIHTKGFSERLWCQQEIGYAVARGVKTIPIKFEEDPRGFVAKYQALIRGKKNAEKIAEDILAILKDSEKTKSLYEEKIAPHTLDDEIPF